MKIDSFISTYSKINKSGKDALKTRNTDTSGVTRSKTDVADFSSSATSLADKSMVSLKSHIQHDIFAGSSAERLDQLKENVRNNTYRIPTEQIVNSMLGGE